MNVYVATPGQVFGAPDERPRQTGHRYEHRVTIGPAKALLDPNVRQPVRLEMRVVRESIAAPDAVNEPDTHQLFDAIIRGAAIAHFTASGTMRSSQLRPRATSRPVEPL